MSTDRGRELHDTLRAEVSRTGFGSTEVLQVITTALATVRRETWEAAIGSVAVIRKSKGTINFARGYEEGVRDALRTLEATAAAALESAKCPEPNSDSTQATHSATGDVSA